MSARETGPLRPRGNARPATASAVARYEGDCFQSENNRKRIKPTPPGALTCVVTAHALLEPLARAGTPVRCPAPDHAAIATACADAAEIAWSGRAVGGGSIQPPAVDQRW